MRDWVGMEEEITESFIKSLVVHPHSSLAGTASSLWSNEIDVITTQTALLTAASSRT